MNRLTFTKEFKKHEEIGHILCLKPEKLIEWEEKLSQYEDIGEPKELIKRPSLDENGLARCGCGGSASYHVSYDYKSWSTTVKVACNKCLIHVAFSALYELRGEEALADDAKRAWNTAMGWRVEE